MPYGTKENDTTANQGQEHVNAMLYSDQAKVASVCSVCACLSWQTNGRGKQHQRENKLCAFRRHDNSMCSQRQPWTIAQEEVMKYKYLSA